MWCRLGGKSLPGPACLCSACFHSLPIASPSSPTCGPEAEEESEGWGRVAKVLDVGQTKEEVFSTQI